MQWLIMGGIPAVLLFFCFRAWRAWQQSFSSRDDDAAARFMLAMGADAPVKPAAAPEAAAAAVAAPAARPQALLAPELQPIYRQLRTELGEQPLLVDVDIARLLPGERADTLPRVQADFVLCKRDFTPVVAIFVERDGGSIAADRAEALLRAQRLRVLRWRADALPEPASLRALLFKPRPAQRAAAAAPL